MKPCALDGSNEGRPVQDHVNQRTRDERLEEVFELVRVARSGGVSRHAVRQLRGDGAQHAARVARLRVRMPAEVPGCHQCRRGIRLTKSRRPHGLARAGTSLQPEHGRAAVVRQPRGEFIRHPLPASGKVVFELLPDQRREVQGCDRRRGDRRTNRLRACAIPGFGGAVHQPRR